MEYKQRLAQVGQAILDALLGDIIEKFALDAERPSGQRNLDLALLTDLVDIFLEQAGDMSRITGGRNSDHGTRIRNAMRGCKRGSAAEAVADQDGRCAARFS